MPSAAETTVCPNEQLSPISLYITIHQPFFTQAADKIHVGGLKRMHQSFSYVTLNSLKLHNLCFFFFSFFFFFFRKSCHHSTNHWLRYVMSHTQEYSSSPLDENTKERRDCELHPVASNWCTNTAMSLSLEAETGVDSCCFVGVFFACNFGI